MFAKAPMLRIWPSIDGCWPDLLVYHRVLIRKPEDVEYRGAPRDDLPSPAMLRLRLGPRSEIAAALAACDGATGLRSDPGVSA